MIDSEGRLRELYSLVSFRGVTTANGGALGANLVCSDLPATVDYDGNQVVITSGTYAGQARGINGTTTANIVTPSSNFGGVIVSGTSFVIIGIRTTTAAVAAIEAKLDLPVPDSVANTYIAEVVGNKEDIANETVDVSSIIGLLRAAITNYLNDGTYGLDALKTLIDAIETKLDTPANFMADVSALALEATLTAIKGAGWTTETLKAIKDAVDAVIPGVGDATQAKQDAIEAKLDLPAANETANTLIGEVIGQKGDAANVTASQASIVGLLRAVITTYLSDGTIGLSNLQTLLAAITAAGPTNAQMETARDAIITEVDANETKIDAVEAKLDDGTSGLVNLKALIDAVEAKLDVPANFKADVSALALEATLGTHDTDIKALIATAQADLDNTAQYKATGFATPANVTAAHVTTDGKIDAVELKLDTPATFMADVSALALEATLATNTDSKAVGKLQVAATTEELNQGAASYPLFTGTTHDVVLEKLAIRIPVDVTGGACTSISIETDDTTAQVFISAATGDRANLTAESQLAWTGATIIKVGTVIQLTIAGAATGIACDCDVVAECRAVVAGGYLA